MNSAVGRIGAVTFGGPMRSSLVLLLAAFSSLAHAQDITGYATWYDRFSKCDQHLAAKAWQVSDDDASVRIQQLVGAGKADEVTAAIEKVKPTITPSGWAVCDYNEPGFTYFDAERLAQHWGLSDVSEAKARIEAKLISHNEALVVRDLDLLRQAGPNDDAGTSGGYDPEAEAKRQVFFAAGYDWCDAELLAAAWGVDFDEAKMRAADLLQAGDKSVGKALKKLKKTQPIPQGCGG